MRRQKREGEKEVRVIEWKMWMNAYSKHQNSRQILSVMTIRSHRAAANDFSLMSAHTHTHQPRAVVFPTQCCRVECTIDSNMWQHRDRTNWLARYSLFSHTSSLYHSLSVIRKHDQGHNYGEGDRSLPMSCIYM